MKKAVIYLLIITVVCIITLIGCSSTSPASSSKPIKIGQIYSFSGPQAPVGNFMLRAATFAFDEVDYEIAGRTIEVISEDDGTRPDMAIDKARKLIDSDNVDLILGPLSQENIEATAPIVAQAGIPQIVPSMVDKKLAQYECTYKYGGTNEQMLSPMGAFAYDDLGFRTLTVMASDSTSGHNFTEGFLAPFLKRGGTVVQEQYPPMGCSDFSPYFASLKDADAVAAWFSGTDALRFHNQFHELGIRDRMPLQAMYFGGFVQLFMLNQGLSPEVADAMLGEHVLATYSYLQDSPVAKKFDEAWMAKYHYHPDDVNATPYSLVQTAFNAIEGAGGDVSPDVLGQAILELNFESPCGHVSFDPETRFAIRDVIICKIVKDGDYYAEEPVKIVEKVPPIGVE